jgi:inosose dehydratase
MENTQVACVLGHRGEAGGLEETLLDAIAEAGYTGIELGPQDICLPEPGLLRSALEKRSLRLAAGEISLDLWTEAASSEALSRALEAGQCIAKLGEAPWLILSAQGGAVHDLSEQEWIRFAENVGRISRDVVSQTGVRTLFRPRPGSPVDSPEAIDRFLDLCDPAPVDLCLDTGETLYSGGNVLHSFYKYGDRIRHIHFTDFNPHIAEEERAAGWLHELAVEKGLFPRLGEGVIDFRAIVDELEGLGFAGWVVIDPGLRDNIHDIQSTLQKSRQFLRALGL